MIKYKGTSTKTVDMFGLKVGDVFYLDNNEYYFKRIKRGNKSIVIVKLSNNEEYSHRIFNPNYEFTVIGIIIENQKVARIPLDEKENDLNSLIKGELFVIATGTNKIAELYKFQRKHGKKIVALNPLTNEEFRIDSGFKFIKIKSV